MSPAGDGRRAPLRQEEEDPNVVAPAVGDRIVVMRVMS
jgi:hypothetical protein